MTVQWVEFQDAEREDGDAPGVVMVRPRCHVLSPATRYIEGASMRYRVARVSVADSMVDSSLAGLLGSSPTRRTSRAPGATRP